MLILWQFIKQHFLGRLRHARSGLFQQACVPFSESFRCFNSGCYENHEFTVDQLFTLEPEQESYKGYIAKQRYLTDFLIDVLLTQSAEHNRLTVSYQRYRVRFAFIDGRHRSYSSCAWHTDKQVIASRAEGWLADAFVPVLPLLYVA